MTLVRHLPLFIGDLVDRDDDHWECFLLLWDICSVVCSFELTTDDVTHLGWLIETYLEAFTSLYGASVTPKMHYLVHLPKQILMWVFTSSILHVHVQCHIHVLFFYRFGPLRQHWCMRFESKNAQIKRFVSSSFKNVPLTVAIHHQQWICHQLATHPSQTVSNFFYSGDEVISGR